MEQIKEFFKIVNDYKLIDIHADSDAFGNPTAVYALNDTIASDLQFNLQELFNDLKYEILKQPNNVVAEIKKDVEKAKKNFFFYKIDGIEYVFQTGIKQIKYSSENNQDENIINNLNGVEIDLDGKQYIDVEAYNIFSQIKFDALVKLESLLDIYFSETDITYKLKTNMTVSDLSLLFRLLSIEKLIEAENNADIYRFIAKNFSTKQSDRLSHKSIKNKFLSPDNTAIKKMKVTLANLKIILNKLDQSN